MVALAIDDALAALTDVDARQAAWETVREASRGCQDCPLWEHNTQTVFGVGPVTARLLFIGEAPGAQEDKAGIPFIGPAGALFSEALEAAGLTREEVYITNTVKHRPHITSGKRDKNRPPKQSEINACRQWSVRELALVRPQVVGCLGAHAAREMLGKAFKLTEQRGQWLSGSEGSQQARALVMATLHPSYVLIQPAESRERVRRTFFEDIAAIAERYRSLA